MIQFWELSQLNPEALTKIMRRAEMDIRLLLPLAQEVIDRVNAQGDTAVVDYTRQFDAANFHTKMLCVNPEEFVAARTSLRMPIVFG